MFVWGCGQIGLLRRVDKRRGKNGNREEGGKTHGKYLVRIERSKRSEIERVNNCLGSTKIMEEWIKEIIKHIGKLISSK